MRGRTVVRCGDLHLKIPISCFWMLPVTPPEKRDRKHPAVKCDCRPE